MQNIPIGSYSEKWLRAPEENLIADELACTCQTSCLCMSMKLFLIEIGPLSWMLNIDDRLPLVAVMPPISWLCWILDLLKFFSSNILGECGVSYEVIRSNTLSRVSFPACFKGLQTPVIPGNACAVQAVVITILFAHAVMMTTTSSLSEASQLSFDMYYCGAWPCYSAREIGLYDEYVYSQLLYLPAWLYLSSVNFRCAV